MRKVFATTKNVKAFLEGMAAVESPDQSRPGMGLVFGEPGTGKTRCTQWYAADREIPYVRATHVMTVRGLLAGIVAELGEKPLHSKGDLFLQAQDLLLDRPRPVFVDEVDYLVPGSAVEVLRDLNDVANVPVVLIGMNKVDRSLQRFPHLVDRLAAVVRFQTFDVEDIASLAEQLCEVPLDASAVEWVQKKGQGKFRRTVLLFARAERLAKANRLDRVTAAHLQRGGENGGPP